VSKGSGLRGVLRGRPKLSCRPRAVFGHLKRLALNTATLRSAPATPSYYIRNLQASRYHIDYLASNSDSVRSKMYSEKTLRIVYTPFKQASMSGKQKQHQSNTLFNLESRAPRSFYPEADVIDPDFAVLQAVNIATACYILTYFGFVVNQHLN
jgi:hypothetical protein